MKHRASSLIFRMLWSRIRRPARPRWVGAGAGWKSASPTWAKTVVASAFSAFSAGSVWALPQGAQVELGQVSLKQTDKTLTVTTSNGAVINWKQFNIANGELARFLQPSAQSQVLNRVTGGDPSLILGQLQSNGRVFLINPSGVVFGRGSRVDVNSLVVSTLPMKTEDFSAGKLQFGGLTGLSRSEGAVRNEGTIQTTSGGFVYLVAPEVENSGLIHSPEGQVILAAGHQVSLVDPARPEVAWEVKAPDSRAVNLGDIVSKQIGLHGQQVLNGGRIQATTAQFDAQGRIVLRASKKVEQTASGSLVARGRDAQGNLTGGDIQIHGGEQVTLAGTVDASARPLSREQAELAVRVPAPAAASGDPSTTNFVSGAGSASEVMPTSSSSSSTSAPIGNGAVDTNGVAPVATAQNTSTAHASTPTPAWPTLGSGALTAPTTAEGAASPPHSEASADISAIGPGSSPFGGSLGGSSLVRLAASANNTEPAPPPAPNPIPTRPGPDPQHLWAPIGLGSGGRVRVSGQNITLSDGSNIDVSGQTQAGTVLIGGERQGQRLGAFDASQPNAHTVTMAATARIQADALGKGQGGHVIVWADDTARVHGAISARGGDQGGDGGFIETSGKRLLEVTRAMDASAPKGTAGEWLLDPANITIDATGPEVISGSGGGFSSLSDSSVILVSTIETALNAGTNVSITTGALGTQLGDITVSSPIATNSPNKVTLTLNAHNNIHLNASISATASGALDLSLTADYDGINGGSVVLGAASVNLNGGAMTANTVSQSTNTFTLNATATWTSFGIDGGTLNTSDALTVGSLNWTGGVITGSANASLNTTGNTTLSGTSTKELRDLIWNNSGVVTLSDSGSLLINSASTTTTVNNLSGATFNVNASGYQSYPVNSGYHWDESTYSYIYGTFSNAGILNWNATNSYGYDTYLYAPLSTQAGSTLNVNENLRLARDSSQAGTVQIASGKELRIEGGSHALTLGSSFSGSGTLRLSGGALSVQAQPEIAPNIALQLEGGTLSLSAGLTLSNALNWTGGVITGSANASLNTTGNTTLSGTSTKELRDLIWNNSGVVTLSDSGSLLINSASTTTTVNNLSGATFNVNASGYQSYPVNSGYHWDEPTYSYVYGTFSNAGILNWNATNSYGYDTYLYAPLSTQAGSTLNVNENLRLARDSSQAGTVQIASGKELRIEGGSHALTLGSSIQSISTGGSLTVAGGNVTANGNLGLATSGAIQISGGVLSWDQQNTTAVTLSSQLNVSSGTLNTSDALTVGSLNWTGGVITGSANASLNTTGNTTLSGTSTKELRDLIWNNSGVVTLSDSGSLLINSASTTTTVNNLSGATFNVNASGYQSYPVNSGYHWDESTYSYIYGTFSNAGILNWNATNSYGYDTYLYAPLSTQAGSTLNVNENLRLARDSSQAGTVQIASGKELRIEGGSHALTLGSSFSGSGTLRLSGGALSVQAQPEIAPNIALQLEGGTLSLSAGLTLSNALNWTGGVITGSANASLNTTGNTTLSGTSTKELRDLIWNNSGVVTLSDSGSLLINSASTTTTVNNLSGATFNVNASGYQSYPVNSGYHWDEPTYSYVYGTFSNAGILNWNATNSYGYDTYLYAPLSTQAGSTLNVNENLRLARDSSQAGTVQIASGKELRIEGGSHALTLGSSIQSISTGGSLTVAGGNVTANGNLGLATSGAIQISGGVLSWDQQNTTAVTLSSQLNVSSGTLNTSDALTVGSLNWTGGVITGSANASLNTTGNTTLSGTSTKELRDLIWNNSGVVTLSDSGSLLINSASTTTTVNNLSGATFNVNASGYQSYPVNSGYHWDEPTYSYVYGTFSNAGILNWNATNSYGYDTYLYAPLSTQAGSTLNVNENLRLARDSSQAGTVQIASGKELRIEGGSHALTLGSSIQSISTGGSLTVAGGNVTANGNLGLATSGAIQISGGVLSWDQQNTTAVTLSSQLNVSSGTLNTSDALTVGSLNWTGGVITGSANASLNTTGNTTLSGTSTKELRDLIWNNSGVVTLSDSGSLLINSASTTTTVNNLSGATFNVNASGYQSYPVNSGYHWDESTYSYIYGTFSNAGILNWNATNSYGYDTYLYAPLSTQAGSTLNVNENLRLARDSSQAGTVQIASGKELRIEGGSHALTLGSSFSGSGTLRLSGGALSVQAQPEIAPNIALQLEGGTLSLSAGLTLSNALNWTGGVITGSANASLNTTGNTTLSGTSTKELRDLIWNNSGVVTLSDSGSLLINSASTTTTVNNLSGATFNVNASGYQSYPVNSGYHWDEPTYSYVYGTFSNAGILNWNATNSYGYDTYLYAPLSTQAGSTLNVNENLRLARDSSQAGTVQIASGKELRIEGGSHALTLGSSIQSISTGGSLTVAGGNVTANGNLGLATSGAIQISGGVLSWDQQNTTAVTLSSQLNVSSGTLNTSDALTVGSLNWTGGVITGSANASLNTTGNTTLSGTSTKELRDLIWNNSGVVTLSDSGSLLINSASTTTTVNNLSGATFNVNASGYQSYPVNSGYHWDESTYSYIYGTFSNAGILNWNATNSYGYDTYLYAPLSNQTGATFNVNENLILSQLTSQAGTIALSNNKSLSTNGANWTNDGLLSGSGTIDLMSGLLTNQGTISPGGSGNVGNISMLGNVLLGSTGVLSFDALTNGADALNITGSVTLNGQLNIADSGQIGTYTLVTAASGLAGSFSNVLTNTSIATVNYSNGLVLTLSAPGTTPYFSWDGGGNGDNSWFNAANWTYDLLPNSTSAVSISGAYSVNFGGSQNIYSLTLGPSASLTLTSGGSLAVTSNTSLAPSSTLTINGGVLSAAGGFSSDGLMQLTGGTLALSTGATATITGGLSLNGSSVLKNMGAQLNISSTSLNLTGTLMTHSGGTTTLTTGALNPTIGNLLIGSDNLSGGIYGSAALFNLNGQATVSDFFQAGGTLSVSAGSNIMLTNANPQWFDLGVWTGGGNINIAPSATAQLGYGGAMFLNNITVNLGVNSTTQILDHILSNGGAQINNSGTLIFENSATTIQSQVSNLGRIESLGQVSVQGGLFQSATGNISVGGMDASQTSGSMVVDGSILVGAGGLSLTSPSGGVVISSQAHLTATGIGTINLSGTGDGTQPHGVVVQGTVSTDAGSLTLTGAGGVRTVSNSTDVEAVVGVAIAGGRLQTASGSISVTGTGGRVNMPNDPSPQHDLGVYLDLGAVIQSTNGGNIHITGFGAPGTWDQPLQHAASGGVVVDWGSTIQTAGAGQITLSGTASAATLKSGGVLIQKNSLVQTLGTGLVAITGQAAGATDTINGKTVGVVVENASVLSGGALSVYTQKDFKVVAGHLGDIYSAQAASLVSVGNQSIQAAKITLMGGESGEGLQAELISSGTQNITASNGMDLLAGQGGDTNLADTSHVGNWVSVKSEGNQTITVGGAGLTLAAGGGLGTDNAARIWNTGATSHQSIALIGGASLTMTGGTSQQINVGTTHGSQAFIQADGSSQSISFAGTGSLNPGVLSLQGGSAGSRARAQIWANGTASVQSITGASLVSLQGGTGGGVAGEGNTAVIGGLGTVQTLDVGSISLVGGSGAAGDTDNYAQIRWQNGVGTQNLFTAGNVNIQAGSVPGANAGIFAAVQRGTISGSLSLSGGTGGASPTAGGGARLGGWTMASNTAPTDILIDVGGNVDLNGGGLAGAGAAIGNDGAAALTVIDLSISGNLSLSSNISGTRIGSSSGALGAGSLLIEAANMTVGASSGINTAGDLVLATGTLNLGGGARGTTISAIAGNGITIGLNGGFATTNTTGTSLTLDVGTGSFSSLRANPTGGLTTATGSQWALYLNGPAKLTNPGSINYAFKQYGVTRLGGQTVLGSGNGIFFGAAAPTLLVQTAGSVSQVYDGNTSADLVGLSLSSSGSTSGDVVSITATSGTFATKSAGTNLALEIAYTSQVTDANGKPVFGYATGGAFSTLGTITPASLSISGLSASSREYDGTTSASVSGTATVTPLGTDQINLLEGTVTANFADKHVGTAKPVNIAGYTLLGTDAGNYTLAQPIGLTADITPKTVTITGITGTDRSYDGSTNATVNASGATGWISGDSVNVSATGTFVDRNVGTSKSVTLTSTYSGSDIGNYTFIDQSSTSANITPKVVSLTASKTYDGTNDLTGAVTIATGVGLETLSYSSATASDAHVATAAKFISAITLDNGTTGDLASNYALPSLDATNAPLTILPRTLNVTLTNTAVSKVYNGDTTSSITPSYAISGFASGDTAASLTHLSVAYASKDVFAPNNVVTVSGLSIAAVTGSISSANTDYVLDAPSKSVAASITAKAVTVSGLTVADRVYDGSTTATVNTTGASGWIAGDAVLVTATGSFSDKNVGTGKLVSLTSSYSGADAGNYTFTDQTSTTASISQRLLSTWTGAGGNSLWSNPLNWDALPDLNNVAAVSLPAGSGSVVFDGSASPVSLQALSNARSLTLNSGGLTLGTLTNSGTTTVNTTLTLGAVANSGQFTVASGTTTVASYSQNVAGAVTTLGTNGGSTGTLATNSGFVDLQAGTLAGSGQIVGSLNVGNATVAPGFSPGNLAISGNLNLSSGSTLSMELASGNSDALSVGGSATLAGTLALSSYSGFVPQAGNQFVLLDATAVSGSFATTSNTDPNLGSLAFSQLAMNINGAILNIPSTTIWIQPSVILAAEDGTSIPELTSTLVDAGSVTDTQLTPPSYSFTEPTTQTLTTVAGTISATDSSGTSTATGTTSTSGTETSADTSASPSTNVGVTAPSSETPTDSGATTATASAGSGAGPSSTDAEPSDEDKKKAAEVKPTSDSVAADPVLPSPSTASAAPSSTPSSTSTPTPTPTPIRTGQVLSLGMEAEPQVPVTTAPSGNKEVTYAPAKPQDEKGSGGKSGVGGTDENC